MRAPSFLWFGYEIYAMRSQWTTFAEAPECESTSAQRSVLLDGFERVTGARGIEAAGRGAARSEALVGVDHPDEQPCGHRRLRRHQLAPWLGGGGDGVRHKEDFLSLNHI